MKMIERVKRPRTPGPYDPDEQGPIAGDIVVEPDKPFYGGGTVPKRRPNGVVLKRPLDQGEVGTGYNGPGNK